MKRFFDGVPSNGEIVGWLPPVEEGECPLWHVRFEDGDEEDLDKDECAAAIAEAKKERKQPSRGALPSQDLPDFGSLALGDRLEFRAACGSVEVFHRGTVVALKNWGGCQSLDLEYRDGRACREHDTGFRTCRINKSQYCRTVTRKLAEAEVLEHVSSERPRAARVLRPKLQPREEGSATELSASSMEQLLWTDSIDKAKVATLTVGSLIQLTYEGVIHNVTVIKIRRTASNKVSEFRVQFEGGEQLKLNKGQLEKCIGKLLLEGTIEPIPPIERAPVRRASYFGKKRSFPTGVLNSSAKRPALPEVSEDARASSTSTGLGADDPELLGDTAAQEGVASSDEQSGRVHDRRPSAARERGEEHGYLPPEEDFNDDFDDADNPQELDVYDGGLETAGPSSVDRLSPEAIFAGLSLMENVFGAAEKEDASTSKAPTAVEVSSNSHERIYYACVCMYDHHALPFYDETPHSKLRTPKS